MTQSSLSQIQHIQTQQIQTQQIQTWSGAFGAEYTERCTFQSVEDFNALYLKRYGLTRDEINTEWLGSLPREARILEIGCNIGNQLNALQRIGFENLYGIDIQHHAVEKSKTMTRKINIIQASVFDIPYKDNFFDLVFTNNVLIHISPETILSALQEIIRVSKNLIWGFEYYAPHFTEIPYRGHQNLLWKADYEKLYLNASPSHLYQVKSRIYPCLDEPGNDDKCFLLQKKSV